MPPAVNSPKASERAVALWMFGATTAFCLVALATRLIGNELATPQLLFFRALIGLLLLLPLLPAALRSLQLSTPLLQKNLWRNGFHLLGQYGWFLGLIWLPLADVTAIEFTTPLFVALLGALFLGETLTRRRQIALVLGLTGIVCIATPTALALQPVVGWVLLSALGYAAAHLLTRTVTRGGQSTLSVLLWMYLLQTPVTGLLALPNWQWPNGYQLLLLILIGSGALCAHLCLTQALARAAAAQVMTYDFLRLPILALLGVIVFNEPLNSAMMLGGLCILIACWINFQSAKAAPARPTENSNPSSHGL